MKNNLPAYLMILVGLLLIYSAEKDRDPRNIIFEALGIKRRVADPVIGKKETDKKPAAYTPNTPANPGQRVVTV